MATSRRRAALALSTALVLAPALSGADRTAAKDDVVLPAAGGPVLLELFTSQGCSSCPAADKVLSILGRDERTRGRVVPLAFHVDYWNRLGWADPFSSPAWTERQYAYQRALGGDSAYTPQLVVDGRRELNGGHGQEALEHLAEALARTPAATLQVSRREAPDPAKSLAVDVAAEVVGPIGAKRAQVMVALYENGVTTQVARGENASKTLENDFIVRRLASAFSFEPKAGARKAGTASFKLEPSWVRERLGVAAFLQDPDTMLIFGAATLGAASAGPAR
jgi:hypothetical protein